MKTINTTSPPILVNVYGKKILLNIDNGMGFCEVFKKMHPSIIKLSSFYCSISNIETSDAYQNICIFMLEGILKYKDKSSLSSFLYLYSYSRVIDSSRKKNIDKISYDCDTMMSKNCLPTCKIDVEKYINKWDCKWKNIMFRVFVREDSISSVAKDESITNWGLTCAIRRKLQEARKLEGKNARCLDNTKTNR